MVVKRKRPNSESETERRVSLRVQEKLQAQKEEKERLVRERVKLLDDDHQNGADKALHEVGDESIHVKSPSPRPSRRASPRTKASGAETKVVPEVFENRASEGAEKKGLGLGGLANRGLRHMCGTPGVSMEKAAHVKVKETLRLFNKHYLHYVQVEEKRCAKDTEKAVDGSKSKAKGGKNAAKGSNSKKKAVPEEDGKKARRPDLKAITEMKQAKEILYPQKKIGNLPGIEVGHRFFSRAEMCAVGFHGHWLNGIDYMGLGYQRGEYAHYTFPLAVSIVISGMYEDDLDNADEVVYTGQGGHDLTGNKRQIQDQTLERGNLALKNCVDQKVPVRVTRGHDCTSSYTKKVYTYDGLYQVVKYWAEKGISGFTVFKYRLKRMEGQPDLTTNQVNFMYGRIPQSTSEIQGLVSEDITGGLEALAIPATNRVDDPPAKPTGFSYIKSLKIGPNVKIPSNAPGCNCGELCVDATRCACAKLNDGDFPYVKLNDGRLVEPRNVIFECGPDCGCGPKCVNRTSQRVPRFRLEVFRTPKKGWAVRSWDIIPSGAPVCEYIGVLRRTEDVDNSSDNDYIFEIDCLQTMLGLGGRERRLRDVSVSMINKIQSSNDQNAPEFCIDAGTKGNIARFINHSCEPNLFVQCVLSSHHDLRLARVVLFAADTIYPLQELTYDYGYSLDSVHGPDGKVKKLGCFCGATACRKRLY